MTAFSQEFDATTFAAVGGEGPEPEPPPLDTSWPPTGMTLRGWSSYLLAQYPLDELPASCGGPGVQPEAPDGGGYNPVTPPVGYGGACDPMKPTIDTALPMLSALTCRNFTTGEDIPDTLKPTATLAVTIYVERLTWSTGGTQREQAMSSAMSNLRSFSAGPYSESYFGPGEVKYAWNVIDNDPMLNSMLLALITPECLANRMAAANGQFPPGWATQEIDWRTSSAPQDPYSLWREGDWLP